MSTVDEVAARLSMAPTEAYRRCAASPPRSVRELERALDTYEHTLQSRATEAEFLDVETAARVLSGCQALLKRLGSGSAPESHRAVQAAVEYLLLDDDGEADDSIVGYDDDLRVLKATAEVLGWDLPEAVG